jgi:hypothetical protein
MYYGSFTGNLSNLCLSFKPSLSYSTQRNWLKFQSHKNYFGYLWCNFYLKLCLILSFVHISSSLKRSKCVLQIEISTTFMLSLKIVVSYTQPVFSSIPIWNLAPHEWRILHFLWISFNLRFSNKLHSFCISS